MHDANDLFLIRKQYDMKQAMRQSLNYFSEADSLQELLYKHHATMSGIAFNFEVFNK
jgi:hypothetical protein